MARFTAPSQVAVLDTFLEHERGHRAIFAAELARRGQPRCASYRLCGAGGYALGVMTGLLGRRAIAATTFAVENVVLTHLQAQLATLHGTDPHAVEAITKIVAEENEHKKHFDDAQTGHSILYPLLLPIIAGATESVIWLGMHLRRPSLGQSA